MGSFVSIPYSGYIHGGITFGNDVYISGMPFTDCKRFSISLCSGPTCETDTAFTFNPRLNDGKVVRNHKQGGSWGMEEINGGMPFRQGQNFEIYMKVEQQGYKVTVNGEHFCNFHHRIPKERVQYLYIEGDVQIHDIPKKGQAGVFGGGNRVIVSNQFGGEKSGKMLPGVVQFSSHSYSSSGNMAPGNMAPGNMAPGNMAPGNMAPGNMAPPPYPGLPSYPVDSGVSYSSAVSAYPGYPTQSSGPMFNPPVPLVTPIVGGLYPGKIVCISGLPKHNPGRFTVNLACGATDQSDIGLCFDVRFNFGSTQNVVVRTHKERNQYGNEERHQSYFPFYPGVNFEMMILAEPSCYKIAVNGQHFTEFMHRIKPFQKASYLNICGDVQLTQVRFQ